MTNQSLAGDKLHIRTGPEGLGLYIVPAEPPFEPGVLDVFQLGMKHSTLARFRAALRENGSFTTDDRQTHATLADGQLSLSFLSKYVAGQRWTAVFGTDVTTAILEAADKVLGDRAPRAPFKPSVNRNADCPCGSGRKYKRCCLARNAAAAAAESQVPATARARRAVIDEIAAAVPLPVLTEYARACRANDALLADPRFWDELGMELGRTGYFAEARRAQEIGVSIAPADAPLVCNLAVSEAELGDVEGGLARMDAVPSDAPQSAIIRGNLLLKAGRFAEAVPYFERAIDEEPEFDLPYLNLIDALEKVGSPQADYWLRRAVERLQGSPDVALAWAEHLHRQDRLEELVDADWIDGLASRAGDTRMIGGRGDDPRKIVAAQLWRGCARLQQGDTNVRIDEVMRQAVAYKELGGDCDPLLLLFALAIQHGAPVALDRIHPLICESCRATRLLAPLAAFRAQAFMVAGEWAHGRDEAERALVDAPEHPAALHALWWALDELGARREALAVAERYAAAKPDDEHIEYNMGLLAGRLGEHGRAVHHYERQTARFPDHPHAHENLAVTLLMEGQLERAGRAFAEGMARLRARLAVEPGSVVVRFEDGVRAYVAGEALDGDEVASLDARQRSFDELLAFARSRIGSPTYARDVIAFNDALHPTLGSRMLVPQSILTVDAMLGALHETNEGRRAELIAAVQRHQRGDRTPFVVQLERHLRWDAIPEAARESLLEAETRFHDGLTRDYAPTVVSYAKAVEVTLLAQVFRPLRDALAADERRQLARDARAEHSDGSLCRYLGDGRALALGDMLNALRRAAGRPSAAGVGATARLRQHVAREELDRLLSPGFIESGLELSRQRNAAAHASTFDGGGAARVRSAALGLLAVLTGAPRATAGTSAP